MTSVLRTDDHSSEEEKRIAHENENYAENNKLPPDPDAHLSAEEKAKIVSLNCR